jgi:CBS domain-containing protein
MPDIEVLEGDEAYFDAEKAPRPLDYRILHEPIRRLEIRPPVCIARTASLSEAVREMQQHRVGYVMVVDRGPLVGILTERDVLNKVLGKIPDWGAVPVESVMTADPEVLTPEDAIVFALQKMSIGGFRHVPVVDDQRRPVGIVSVRHVVDWVVGFFPEHVLNVPPEPGMLPQQPEGG